MKSEAASDNTARQGTEVYQVIAREAWHAGEVGGFLRLTVTSDSMRPLLHVGDVVVVQPSEPRALPLGAVIVVQRDGEWITHRLVAVDEHSWYTHGDSTRYTDEAAGAAEIVGRVIAIERGDQMIDVQQPHWRTVDRRINRVQHVQLQLFTALRKRSGARSSRFTHALAAVIDWPFQLAVRFLTRF